ncbi:MAG: hypothetical protein QXO76_08660 [Thermoproteota archaeon]
MQWWESHKKDYPWRRTSDPYKILIAELLLRKTTAKQVEAVYEKFLSKYPDPVALSRASERELKDVITPLGMEHKRAVLLKKVGYEIVRRHSGRLPASREELMQIPGVGPYVANAVLCFAYGRDVPLVDTNAVRIFQRVFGFRPRRRRARDDPRLWNLATQAIPRGRARDFNLAVIDLAHLICLPRKPRCEVCTLSALCKYARERRV